MSECGQCFERLEVSSSSYRRARLTDRDNSSYWESSGRSGSHWIRLHIKKGMVIRWVEVVADPAFLSPVSLLPCSAPAPQSLYLLSPFFLIPSSCSSLPFSLSSLFLPPSPLPFSLSLSPSPSPVSHSRTLCLSPFLFLSYLYLTGNLPLKWTALMLATCHRMW